MSVILLSAALVAVGLYAAHQKAKQVKAYVWVDTLIHILQNADFADDATVTERSDKHVNTWKA